MTATNLRRIKMSKAILLATSLASIFPFNAYSQSTFEPEHVLVDDNGVDLLSGTYDLYSSPLSIGTAGYDALVLRRDNATTLLASNYDGRISIGTGSNSNIITVTVGKTSEKFIQNGSVYTPSNGGGSTLVHATSSAPWVYTLSNGTEYTLFRDAADPSNVNGISQIKYTNGKIETFSWTTGNFTVLPCTVRPCQTISRQRLSSINNNLGAQLKFEYSSNSTTSSTNIVAWRTLSLVRAINNAVEYCDPAASSCSGLTQDWPVATFAQTTTGGVTVTDVVHDSGESWRYTTSSTSIGIKRPSAANDTTSVTLSGGRVSAVARDGITTSYNFSDNADIRTTTVTAPGSTQTVVTSSISKSQVLSVKNPLNQITNYQYDSSGRLSYIVTPEGTITSGVPTSGFTKYSYDARGNVLEVRQVAKTGAGLPDIVTTAGYDLSCISPAKCNKPNWTKDAKGNQTNYTYDSATGSLLTVTKPAALSGGIAPKTTYSYSTKQAYYKNSSGSIVASGQAISLLTGISVCQTTATCAGVSDETVRTIDYGLQTAGIANNLRPVGYTARNGNSTLSATNALTYDVIGNVQTVDGPLSGTADVMRYRYDAARRVVGVIGPDPDGAGALKFRARRTTYNADGQPTIVEQGTVNSQSDADWNGFVSLQQLISTYDGNARKSSDKMTAGGTIYSVAQYGYDNLGRVECTSVRMNSATWGSLPTSACTLQSAGAAGPDRITKTNYDSAGQVTSVIEGLGTSGASTVMTATYSNNGKQLTLKDGENNLTTYEYDGFDRLSKTRFPRRRGQI